MTDFYNLIVPAYTTSIWHRHQDSDGDANETIRLDIVELKELVKQILKFRSVIKGKLHLELKLFFSDLERVEAESL